MVDLSPNELQRVVIVYGDYMDEKTIILLAIFTALMPLLLFSIVDIIESRREEKRLLIQLQIRAEINAAYDQSMQRHKERYERIKRRERELNFPKKTTSECKSIW